MVLGFFYLDYVFHLNDYLDQLATQFGPWIYLLLFLIVFCETGLVVTPFLPGDALLFTVGALCATTTHFHILAVLILLSVAAFLGDTANYWIGAAFGDYLTKRKSRLVSARYLAQTHAFYERYGAKTVVLARYLPVLRTFAPFVAGMGAMKYTRFFWYNLIGGVLWVFSVVLLGFYFGRIPFVRSHFSLVILAIILVSMMPPAFEFFREWRRQSPPKPGSSH